jgi:hypothetical protein
VPDLIIQKGEVRVPREIRIFCDDGGALPKSMLDCERVYALLRLCDKSEVKCEQFFICVPATSHCVSSGS